ncbi:MAG: LON peptidase substrate-binding domain-containing protein [Dehalococcoidia bacterium]|nr:LON peptidase substrate-binding domain-containing protein [Dehalococcoidia bacterium]
MQIIDMPLFPLNTVLFPHMALPLRVFEDRYKLMVKKALEGDSVFGVALIKSGQEVGEPAEPFSVGTTARILKVEHLEQGKMDLSCVGVRRFRITEVLQRRPYLVGRIIYVAHAVGDTEAAQSLAETVRDKFRRYLAVLAQSLRREPPRVDLNVEPQVLSYVVASALQVDNIQKQRLLETPTAEERLRLEAAMLQEEIKVLRIFQVLEERDLGGRRPPRGPDA